MVDFFFQLLFFLVLDVGDAEATQIARKLMIWRPASFVATFSSLLIHGELLLQNTLDLTGTEIEAIATKALQLLEVSSFTYLLCISFIACCLLPFWLTSKGNHC